MMDSATVKWWELQHLSNKWFTSRYNASQILKGVLGFAEDLDWHRFTMGIKKTIYLKKDEPDSPPLLNLVTSFCVDSHWRSWLCCYNCQLVKVESFSIIQNWDWLLNRTTSEILNYGTRVCASALSAAKLCPKLLLKHLSASCQQSKESSGEEASLKSHSWKC